MDISVIDKPADFHFFEELLDYELSGELKKLRDDALRRQSNADFPPVPGVGQIEARLWQNRPEDEDWLMWRARRNAARLREMPIALSDGERLVGRPEFREPTAEEERELEKFRPILDAIPPFPGGDAGHFHPDYEQIFQIGIKGIREEIRRLLETSESEQKSDKKIFYTACETSMHAFSDFVARVGMECEKQAALSAVETFTARWREMAAICGRISTEPPATFHEAIELMFLMIIALWFTEDHGLTCPGRMDRTLNDFYLADLAAGRITREEALEYICSLYIQMNMILHAGSAVAVMVGGREADGADATNELTYLCLIARKLTKLVYPTVGLAWHSDSPPELLNFACRIISTGVGDPAFFNDELISDGLQDHGVSQADSINYMNSTCVEIKPVGTSHIWVTAPYYNCPQALLDIMDEVADGSISSPKSYDTLAKLVQANLAKKIGETAQKLNGVWNKRAEAGCFPLASCFIKDCLANGVDFDRGGARYNWVENSFVGLANLADSLYAVKHLVYDTAEMSLADLRNILVKNFSEHEDLRQRILTQLPKYGNNQDEIDDLAVEWADFLTEITESFTVGIHRYVPGYFCWVVHERMGKDTGTTPDGRPAGFPLADGAGAAQGREKNGPTASILSTTKWSHRKALGGLVHNLKFSKSTLQSDSDLLALRSLIETYMSKGGFEIQVNVVSSDELRDAQKHPDRYRDLLVRVAGYSDYFVHLNANMQEEVIARTEHSLS